MSSVGFVQAILSPSLIERDSFKECYIGVDGKVRKAMLGGDEGEGANDGEGRGAGLQLMKVFNIGKI